MELNKRFYCIISLYRGHCGSGARWLKWSSAVSGGLVNAARAAESELETGVGVDLCRPFWLESESELSW